VKSLVITTSGPPHPEHDVHGLYRRLGLFVRALGNSGGPIEILHVVAGMLPDTIADDALFIREQSRYWDAPVHPVVVCAPDRRPNAWNYVAAPFSIGARPRFLPYASHSVGHAIVQALEKAPDVVFVHRLAAMSALWKAVARPHAPVLFDLDDIEHRMKLRIARESRSLSHRTFHYLQVPGLLAAEKRATQLAARTFVCSETDREYLAGRGTYRGVVVVPNAVSIPEAPLPGSEDPVVLFLGGYHYEPNVRAAQRLATRIWPRVRRALPQARLIIAGGSPEAVPASKAPPEGVEFPGFVADLEALYRATRVVCCPLELGAGTRVKLIEAAGHARALVSTRLGAEGLDFKEDSEILLRESDEELALACIGLLSDARRAQDLGLAAYARARELYDRENIQRLVQAHIAAVLEDPRG
jgi:glycosyltransferase involved in cell wall biosynthesis